VLVPDADGRFSVSFAGVKTWSSGFSAVITVNGRTERVTATATGSSVVPLN
jgi:hypothetical protein